MKAVRTAIGLPVRVRDLGASVTLGPVAMS
jgi:hypothetical protein